MTEVGFNEFDGSQNPVSLTVEGTDEPLPTTPIASVPRTREKLDFQIRVDGQNRLLEAAMPILGLATRMRKVSNYQDIAGLHGRLRNEISSFQQELESLDYDPATVLAARYVICACVDEAVLSQVWGAESMWSERPMLAVFHNETWGGEKVFAIIDRVMDEAHRFVDLLEFLYYCIALGFEGKYHVMHNGQAKLDALLKSIHTILVKHQGEAPERVLKPDPNIFDTTEKMRLRFPIWAAILTVLVLLFVIHTVFDQSLTARVNDIGTQIGATINETEGGN